MLEEPSPELGPQLTAAAQYRAGTAILGPSVLRCSQWGQGRTRCTLHSHPTETPNCGCLQNCPRTANSLQTKAGCHSTAQPCAQPQGTAGAPGVPQSRAARAV